MSEESEHDNIYEDLHHAFGAEVADLDIGATPAGAVMASGAALRVRRRLTAVSGVAALAVLPVAAVAIFSGGGGANGNGGTEAAAKFTGTRSSAAHTPSAPGGMTRPESAKTPTPSTTAVLPQQTLGGTTTAPDSHDVITVVGTGVTEGHPWRLVRDEYVVAEGQGLQDGRLLVDQPHLPISRLGSAGTGVCVFIGVQWGDQPAGTQPDFNAAGQCSTQHAPVTGPLSLGPTYGPVNSDRTQWVLIGQVDDTSKVAKVSVSSAHGTTAPQAVFPVPGERDGYYAVFLPSLTEDAQHRLTITTYDTGGHVVGHTTMG